MHDDVYVTDSNNAFTKDEWLAYYSYEPIRYAYLRMLKRITTERIDKSDDTTYMYVEEYHYSYFCKLDWNYPTSEFDINNKRHSLYQCVVRSICTNNERGGIETDSFCTNAGKTDTTNVVFSIPASATRLINGELVTTTYFEKEVYPETSTYVSKVIEYLIVDAYENFYGGDEWYLNSQDKLSLAQIHQPNTTPVPPAPTQWYLDNGGQLKIDASHFSVDNMGAFSGSSNFKKLILPDSVISLGKKTCHDTQVFTVTLPDECTYYKTTFPESCSVTGGRKIVDYGTRIRKYKCTLNEVTSDTTLTTNITCNVGDLVVATFVIRGDTYTISEDWTLLGLSEAVGSNQRTGLAYKTAESTTENLTITQDTSDYIYTNLVALTGASIGSFSGFTIQATGISITATKPNGLVLWAVSASGWSSSKPYPLWLISNTTETGTIQSSITQPRCLTVLDQSNDETMTFTARTSGNLGLACASLIITGISDFWYYD